MFTNCFNKTRYPRNFTRRGALPRADVISPVCECRHPYEKHPQSVSLHKACFLFNDYRSVRLNHVVLAIFKKSSMIVVYSILLHHPVKILSLRHGYIDRLTCDMPMFRNGINTPGSLTRGQLHVAHISQVWIQDGSAYIWVLKLKASSQRAQHFYSRRRSLEEIDKWRWISR